MKYKHLTQEERYDITALKKANFNQRFIANELKVSESTISRELKRNSSSQKQSYSAINAHKVSVTRRIYASKKSNLKIDIKLKNIIRKYIIKDWSPEQIDKRLKEVNLADISYVSIYLFIEQDKHKGGDLYTHLRFHHTGHRRAKYGAKHKGRIKDRISISQREQIVDDKSRVGDWEIDTIVGAGKQGTITTVVERVTSLVRISIPTTKKAIDIENETIRILKPLKDKIFTITSDN